MKSFVPILSGAVVFVSTTPSSHAFLAARSVVNYDKCGPNNQKHSSATTFRRSSSPNQHGNVLLDHDDEIRGDGEYFVIAAGENPRTEKRRSSSPLERGGSVVASSLAAAASILLGAASSAFAVSGGGLDYAGLDITGRDFSNGDYKGKDFTQTIAKGATFAKSSIQGCRFYKAYLVNANFEGADARGASFEDTSMDNANLRNINAAGSYFGQSLLDVESLEGGDFTDAQIPTKTLKLVCDREDVKGTNPTTGADTRDSLMCL